AARPEVLLRQAFSASELRLSERARAAPRIVVLGAGKAGAAMSEALEEVLADQLAKMTGVVNVPAESVRPLRAIRLHAARPAASNQPTAEGVAGAEEILALAGSAGPGDLALCLLS